MNQSEFGKFCSAEELLKGYNQLEKSFTQKCQELAEAKQRLTDRESTVAESVPQTVEEADSGGFKEDTNNSDGTSEASSPSGAAVATVPQGSAALSNSTAPTPTQEQLQQYILANPQVVKQLLQQNSPEVPDIMHGGGNVTVSLPSRPRTIKEASVMARELFN